MKELIQIVKELNNNCFIGQQPIDCYNQDKSFVLSMEIMTFRNFESNTYFLGICLESLDYSFLPVKIEELKILLNNNLNAIHITESNLETPNEKTTSEELIFNGLFKIFYNENLLNTEQVDQLYNKFKLENYKLKLSSFQTLLLSKKFKENKLESFKNSVIEFKDFLEINSGSVENTFQNKIKSNLKLLDLYGDKYFTHPRHFKYPENKKNILGYKTLIPDFLIQTITGEYIIIEIERPNKVLMTQSGQQTSKFTQAVSQVNQWEILLQKYPESIEKHYPGISTKRRYLIVYGRDSEFTDLNNKKESFEQILANTKENVELITFDDLVSKSLIAIDNINKEISLAK